jgi:hypothetical protein
MLSKKQFERFEDLVNDVSLPSGRFTNGRRVIGRLRMREFVEKHGTEACDVAFKKIMEQTNAAKSTKTRKPARP